MNDNDLVRIDSETAKGGFANERAIAEKFDHWKKDKEAQKWLKIMDYKLEEIEKVEVPKEEWFELKRKILLMEEMNKRK